MRRDFLDDLRIWSEMARAVALTADKLDRAVREAANISLAEYELMVRIESSGGRMLMGQLAAHLILSKSGVTRIVMRLEKANLIVREIPADNRRATWAVLTKQGRARIQSARPSFDAELKECFGEVLSKPEMRQFAELLSKLNSIWPATNRPEANYAK